METDNRCVFTYRSITDLLFSSGIGDREECKNEAAILLSHFCGVKRAELPFRREEPFSSESLSRAVMERCAHTPLQYLIGEWQFCNERYLVSPDCLIPRMETELLVQRAAETLPEGGRFLDLCTGSGCIAVSLAAMREDSKGVAVELFPKTLAIASRNAARNRVSSRLTFIEGDVLHPATLPLFGTFDLILSNPPYIPTAVIDTLSPEVRKEPRAALDGGEDGLDFYRVLLLSYPRFLTPGGKMILEIGYDQKEAIETLAKATGLSCEVCCDLSGQDRVAVLSPSP